MITRNQKPPRNHVSTFHHPFASHNRLQNRHLHHHSATHIRALNSQRPFAKSAASKRKVRLLCKEWRDKAAEFAVVFVVVVVALEMMPDDSVIERWRNGGLESAETLHNGGAKTNLLLSAHFRVPLFLFCLQTVKKLESSENCARFSFVVRSRGCRYFQRVRFRMVFCSCNVFIIIPVNVCDKSWLFNIYSVPIWMRIHNFL